MFMQMLAIQDATLRARARTADPYIGTSVAAGLVQIERVIPVDGSATPDVVPMAKPMSIPDAIEYLNNLQ